MENGASDARLMHRLGAAIIHEISHTDKGEQGQISLTKRVIVMHHRLFRRICLLLAMLMVVSNISSVAFAQSTPTSASTVEELQAQNEELQAQVDSLQKENGKLKQRINDLSGPKGAETTPATKLGDTNAIGETFTNEYWSITVTGYEVSPTIDSRYETNTARGVYALVYFTVINEGANPSPFPYKDLGLADSEGRTYTVDKDSLFNLTNIIFEVGPSTDDLQPGLPYSIGVAFDIPATSTGLNFTTSEDVFTFVLD